MNSEHRYAIELSAHELAMLIDALERRVGTFGGPLRIEGPLLTSGELAGFRRSGEVLLERMKAHQPYVG